MENSDIEIRKNAAKSGLTFGIISLVLGILTTYLIASSKSMWAVTLAPLVISLIIPLVIAIFFTIDLRKKAGGFWSFRQATSAVFIMLFIGYVISAAANYVFVKFIEPDITEKISQNMIASTSAMMENSGAGQDQIDETVEKMEQGFEEQKNAGIGKTLQGVAIAAVVIFIISLIFGAIFKKEGPIFIQPEDE